MNSNTYCKTEMTCAVHTSENTDKIKTAISNIFPECVINHQNFSITAKSYSVESLAKLRESIQARRAHKLYRRILDRHLCDDSTWFYLNKQAAFAKKIIVCDSADESPLGPIRVILTSKDIHKVIEWILCDMTPTR